jgi:hypothetical protein
MPSESEPVQTAFDTLVIGMIALRLAGTPTAEVDGDTVTEVRYNLRMTSLAQTIPPVDGVYVDQPWLLMRWDDAHKVVHSEWRAFANSAELRVGLLRGLDAIKDHHALGYLTDTRKVKVVVREDQLWIQQTWIPLAIAAGLKRVAVITATRGLGKLTVEEVVGMTEDQSLESCTFESAEAAWRWVSTKHGGR